MQTPETPAPRIGIRVLLAAVGGLMSGVARAVTTVLIDHFIGS